jgi:hypothetical protein
VPLFVSFRVISWIIFSVFLRFALMARFLLQLLRGNRRVSLHVRLTDSVPVVCRSQDRPLEYFGGKLIAPAARLKKKASRYLCFPIF